MQMKHVSDEILVYRFKSWWDITEVRPIDSQLFQFVEWLVVKCNCFSANTMFLALRWHFLYDW